ncbi:MAG: gliding motility-associated C-terminal domain-containing protein [Bacteroidota bacterium]|nr:gliding motility-associated C-terminal domain-containing protein [Bacteroidota bacterium]
MIKRILLFLFFILFSLNSFSTHIVGGYISMKYLGVSSSAANNVNYEVTLIIYRDQGGVNLPNPVTGIKVFNGDNDTIGFGFSLELITQQFLNFGDSCFMPENLLVEEFVYKDTIELSLFSEGYYFAWETCCRNAGIINIDNPLSAGTTYKSEIMISDPNNGFSNLQNSSPTFGYDSLMNQYYPHNAYLCKEQEHTFNFNAVDPDGDSLAYSLATPLNCHPFNWPLGPSTKAAPYDTITWANSSYNTNNPLGAGSYMYIDAVSGDLTSYATNIGVYVFSVRIEQWRELNGVWQKIGEVVQDIQYETIDCEQNNAPTITIDEHYEDGVFIDSNYSTLIQLPYYDTLRLSYDAFIEKEVCLKIAAQDLDSNVNIFQQMLKDSVSLYCELDLFNAGLDSGSNMAFFINDSALSNVSSNFYWTPICNNMNNSPFYAYFYSKDISCFAYHSSVLEVELNLKQPNNNPPRITEMTKNAALLDSAYSDTIKLKYTAEVGKEICYPISVKDEDTYNSIADYLTLQIRSFKNEEGVNVQEFEFIGDENFTLATSDLCWKPTCIDIEHSPFTVTFLVYDDACRNDSAHLQIEFEIVEPTTFDIDSVIPNVFSPNDDGVNDYFEIPDVELNYCFDTDFSIKIFTRWGKKVFEDEKVNFRWDGKMKNGIACSDGVYFYNIKSPLPVAPKKGTISIIR